MRKYFAALVLIALVACNGAGTLGGGTSSSSVLPMTSGMSPDASHHRQRRSPVTIVIPRQYPRMHPGRRAHFVSSATRGIKIVATWTGGSSSSPSYVSTTVATLGPSAPGCTGTATSFVCTVTALVWEGPNTITVTTYDTAPSGGKIPAIAKELGTASVHIVIKPGVTPSIGFFLGGVVGAINGSPAVSTTPADGNTHSIGLVVAPTDFGNQPIQAGANDPYANPINVALTESGGSGHSVLVLNGTPSGASAKLNQSADTIAVKYDGGGAAGYSVAIALTAKGAPAQNLQISPLFVAGNGLSAHTLNLNGASTTPRMTITEAGIGSTQTYSLSNSGCSGIAATPGGVSGSGASATFVVNGGATASATGCTITVTDGLYNTALAIPVTNTPIGGTVTAGGVKMTLYSVPATPGAMTIGPDNHLWFVGGGTPGSSVYSFNIGSSPAIGTNFTPSGTNAFYSITAGPDGALWMDNIGVPTGLERVTTSGTATYFKSPSSNLDCPPADVIPALNGTLWAGACGRLFSVTVGGGYTTAVSGAPLASPSQLVIGPDGALWMGDGNNVLRWDGTTLSTAVTAPAGSTVSYIASAPNDGTSGSIWFTANLVSTTTTGYVVRVPLAGGAPYTAQTRATLNGPAVTGSSLQQIVAPPDGNIWFTDADNDSVDRLSTSVSATPQPFALPAPNPVGPKAMVVAPDGTLWFAACTPGYIGHIVP